MSTEKSKNLKISINYIYDYVDLNGNIKVRNQNLRVSNIIRNLKTKNFFVTILINKEYKNIEKIESELHNFLKSEGIENDEVIFEDVSERNSIIFQGTRLSFQEFLLNYNFQSIFPTVSVVSSFYNESRNIDRFWRQLNELTKYLNIKEFIFVDNGSNDNTLEKLNCLALKDSRVTCTRNENPTCYSKGFSSGISLVNSEYTLITHSDCQINIDTTIKRWLESSLERKLDFQTNSKLCIFSYRLNRPPLSQLLSYVNNTFAKTILSWPLLIDFNAQPKIIHSSLIKSFYFDKGYLFDLALLNWLNKLKNKRKDIRFLNPIAVIDSPRLEGISSWSSSPFKFFKISFSYIFFALNMKLKN